MAKKKEIELDPVAVQNKARMDEIIAEINVINEQRVELEAVFNERVRLIKEQWEDKDLLQYTRIRHLEEELKVLMDTVPKAETKTQFKVSLLCGDVILKKATKKIDYDKKKLLDYALANNLMEYVSTKEVQDFKWAEFKSELDILEDDVIIIKETGEVVNIDGLGVIEVPEELVIK
ncbi:host-nuclease inhibitor Gam family protein [Niameybacter massiliensis]|uniref:Host-nuclease inhibitor Gam family protein n=1 Tax=Holtiella tumoricola TaxID=3018743 RepID=A0AA42DME2_9FIRM|nr:host-nuclease inhibitor Gam family protein [Holtiella tumoricola]MDA3731547.1 host-nuclease inhibitor Gam family protein [Holtiella tumoricola]